MGKRLTLDERGAVLETARREAAGRGQRRLGTDHLLLAVLRDRGGTAERLLGIDVDAARRALDRLDTEALEAVGVHAGDVATPSSSPGSGRVRFTDGARAALVRSVTLAKGEGATLITARHLTAGLVSADAPDPAVAILRAAGVDLDVARQAVTGADR